MQSRNEEILKACVEGGNCGFTPRSRLEQLLFELKQKLDAIESGGGSGKTEIVEIYSIVDGITANYNEAIEAEGSTANIEVVEKLPDSITPCDLDNGIFYFYIVDDTGIGYCDVGTGVMTLGQVIGQSIGVEDFDKGWSTDINAETEDGIYCVRTVVDTNNASGAYVLELNAESGTLTDEQYNAVVANAPNVVIKYTSNGMSFYIPFALDVPDYQMLFINNMIEDQDGKSTKIDSAWCIVAVDKQYQIIIHSTVVANTTYVDNAVANASGGRTLKTIEAATVTELCNSLGAITDLIPFKLTYDGVINVKVSDSETEGIDGGEFPLEFNCVEDEGMYFFSVYCRMISNTVELNVMTMGDEIVGSIGKVSRDMGAIQQGELDLSNVTKFTAYYF